MFRAPLHSLILLAVISLLPAAAFAAPLGLTHLFPDVVSGTIDVVYDTSGAPNTFTASGFALEIQDDAFLPNIQLDAPGGFLLNATMSDAGALLGGTILVTGTAAGEGYNSGTLISGNLTNFGWAGDASGMVFEFTFDVTGGDLAPEYLGLPGGVILGTTLNSFGGFAVDFDNLIFDIPGTGSGAADTAPVPEPSTALLLGAGLVGLAVHRRRSR